MSNRTDFENVATELIEMISRARMLPTSGMRERLSRELHNAYVAGQEEISGPFSLELEGGSFALGDIISISNIKNSGSYRIVGVKRGSLKLEKVEEITVNKERFDKMVYVGTLSGVRIYVIDGDLWNGEYRKYLYSDSKCESWLFTTKHFPDKDAMMKRICYNGKGLEKFYMSPELYSSVCSWAKWDSVSLDGILAGL